MVEAFPFGCVAFGGVAFFCIPLVKVGMMMALMAFGTELTLLASDIIEQESWL